MGTAFLMKRDGLPTRRPRLPAVLNWAWALALGACATSTVVEEPRKTQAWTAADCPAHEAAAPVRCGSVEVFEDRETESGRTLEIRTIVLGATGADPVADPIFILVGGPGQGAADFALDIAPAFERARERRDVVFVDQRGTGEANPLDCALPEDPQAAFGAVFARRVIADCRAALEERAELGLYTTAAFADDLDDVREALGYERINLSGGSYGTRAALVYARRHPEHTRTLVLDGVFPVTLEAALPYARTADDSLRRILDDCETDAECLAAFPDLESRLEAMLAAWNGPREVDIEVADGERATVAFAKGDFGYGIRGIQYGARAWALPRMLWAAVTSGELAPIAEAYYRRADAVWEAISIGHHLSVFCAEDLPFVDEDEVAPKTDGTYLGRYLYDEYAEACELWVQGAIEDDYREPTRSDVPALLFSGARDPITPPWTAEEAAKTLSSSLHVVFPFGGHGYTGGDDGGCKGRIIDRFLDLGSVEGVDTSCVDEIEPAGFELAAASSG